MLAVGTGVGPRIVARDLDDELDLHTDDVIQIVHDLKNPLSTIALEMCLIDDPEVDRTCIRTAVERVSHNVAFLDRMVHDLLDLCALGAGQLELHVAPTDLRALLADTIERVVATRDHGRVHLDATETITVAVDALRIERVVANLLQNALKYTPRTTPVVVSLEHVHASCCIAVSDRGPGLSRAESALVFERYRRASSSAGYAGHGLGLYASRRIVEAHGGRIGVDSAPGAGARFFFDLPLH